jgi:sugar fermentation stimulation protein A
LCFEHIDENKILAGAAKVKGNFPNRGRAEMYRYPKLLKGKFIKRYKRFFADVLLDGEIVTAHNPNTGTMKCIVQEGRDVILSVSDNPNRKLKYTLEGFLVDGKWVLTNTILMNTVVKCGILDNEVEELKDCKALKSEYKFGDGRIDFYGERAGGRFLAEVKNATLFDDEYCMFPDAVTERGLKHIGLLLDAMEQGYTPYMIYVCQVDRPFFRVAYEIDPKYSSALDAACGKGLNVITVMTDFDIEKGEVRLVRGGLFSR